MSKNISKNKIVSILLITLLFFYTPIFLLAQEDGASTNISAISINLKNVSIMNMMNVLSKKTGMKFVVDPAIKDRKINVQLKNIQPDKAITAIMESNGLGYKKLEGINVYMVSDYNKIMSQTAIIKRISCQFASADKLQGIVNKVATKGFGVVLSDSRTNSLIIKDNPGTMKILEDLINELDKPTPQIYIEAAIAEVSLDKNKEAGLEWLWKDPNIASNVDGVRTRFDLRPSSGGSGGPIDLEGNPLGQGMPMGSGIGIGIVNIHIDAVLHALQTDYNLNILSRPYLVTLDNQEAVIEVGDQIPYKSLNQYGITSYEFKSASVKLIVKPHINNDSTMTIELRPNADFQNGQTPDGIPIIATRRANTSVKVKNGKTIVIGGLMREQKVESVSKVPILGSIPLLGFLFRKTVKSSVKTELVIFITPRIVTEGMTNKMLNPKNRLSEKALKKLDMKTKRK
ncbi:MAG: secretin N-terminal domain-containing protein [Candidatus Marinimicrobia bacterium]|nr:secretin N-terminal domain-containing protein [Candidatus Neomarinimicrobiota bacterium]